MSKGREAVASAKEAVEKLNEAKESASEAAESTKKAMESGEATLESLKSFQSGIEVSRCNFFLLLCPQIITQLLNMTFIFTYVKIAPLPVWY